jgi:hypothetical protein
MGGCLMLVIERQLVSKTPSENAKGQSQERDAPEQAELPDCAQTMQSHQT